jgi:hypothetical protein
MEPADLKFKVDYHDPPAFLPSGTLQEMEQELIRLEKENEFLRTLIKELTLDSKKETID